MPFQPAIDEPSKAWPSLNLSSPKAFTGTETCCSLPLVSVKRKVDELDLVFFDCLEYVARLPLISPDRWVMPRNGEWTG